MLKVRKFQPKDSMDNLSQILFNTEQKKEMEFLNKRPQADNPFGLKGHRLVFVLSKAGLSYHPKMISENVPPQNVLL